MANKDKSDLLDDLNNWNDDWDHQDVDNVELVDNKAANSTSNKLNERRNQMKRENFEEDDPEVHFIEDDFDNLRKNESKRSIDDKKLEIDNLEDDYGFSQKTELSHTIKSVTEQVIPTIKAKIVEYKVIYDLAEDQLLREEVIGTLRMAQKADNDVITYVSSEYLNTDQEVLALANLSQADIEENIQETKAKIFQVKKKMDEMRSNMKKFQLANLRLKTRLVHYIS